MLYSGNIGLDAELSLKRLAAAKNLLLMGPDCGTAIINQVPLGIANRIRYGTIGIVASSGTGIQEVSCLLDRAGLGVSCAYGTGARDFTDAIGGISAQTAIWRLNRDKRTQIILVIGKTPGRETRTRLAALCARLSKPVILYYPGVSDLEEETSANIECAVSLADLAVRAIRRLAPVLDTSEIFLPALDLPSQPLPRGFLRGVFSGGALCHEAAAIAAPLLEGDKYSNLHVPGFIRDMATNHSQGHAFLDLGLEEFTVGRPHPLLSPEIKLDRMMRELCDPRVSVVLTDIVLGYGSAPNQGLLLLQTLDRAASLSLGTSRNKKIVLSVCGTESDEPSRSSQIVLLQEAGICVLGNNVQAAEYAAKLASGCVKSHKPGRGQRNSPDRHPRSGIGEKP
jgi:FdrA protein